MEDDYFFLKIAYIANYLKKNQTNKITSRMSKKCNAAQAMISSSNRWQCCVSSV